VLDLARETGGAVKVAIIGTGKMGRGFATALAPKHQVTVGSRDPNRARQVASATGAARGATYAEAAADAEVVILTVPWNAIEETLRQLGELKQTVVIDVSFPYRKSEREALLERAARPPSRSSGGCPAPGWSKAGTTSTPNT
jgi:predicted dinucleotide-binding enzyme